MKKFMLIACIIPVLLAVLTGIVACSSPETNAEVDAIRAYADPETETILQGLSENDLAKYVEYGDAQFKAAVTAEILQATYEKVHEELGTYESKEFLSTEEQQGYIIVHYRATFTKGEVGVRMVFDQDHLIAGQWFE